MNKFYFNWLSFYREHLKDKLLKKLGKRIKQLRESKKLSQSELANIIGKDQQSVQRLEKGRINPSFFYLHEIAKGLEVDIKELFEWE